MCFVYSVSYEVAKVSCFWLSVVWVNALVTDLVPLDSHDILCFRTYVALFKGGD